MAAEFVMPASSLSAWVSQRVREHVPVVSLRDYQDEAVDAIAQAVQDDEKRRVVVVLATGGGKTVVFGALVHAWLSGDMGRVLVLAHRDELITQAVAKMALWIPRHLIGVVKAARNEVDAPVVVASVQTLRNDRRLEQVGQFGLIVVDECHHAAAASYKKILGELSAFATDGPVVVGVTATPQRGDGIRIDDVFEDVVYRKTYTELVGRGWLVPAKATAFDLIAHEQQPKLGIDGDYSESWLGGMMLGANAPEKILEAWQEHAEDRPTIVFTPLVSVAKAVAAAFNDAGIASAWVSGAMPIVERRAALEGLRTGAIRVVANCGVLTEGFDEPSVSCIVIGRPTMNEQLYIQMVGRGTRCLGQDIHESRQNGKHDLLVLDMVGCSDQLQLDAVVELGGRKISKGVSSTEPLKREIVEVPFQTTDGILVARSVKAVRPVCRWVSLPDGWYALSLLSEGWITAEADDAGTWRVVYRPKRGRPTVEYTDLSIDMAKSVGEGVALDKSKRAGRPMHQRAGWLDRPVSEASLKYGLSVGLPMTTETTAWEKTVMEAELAYQRWRR